MPWHWRRWDGLFESNHCDFNAKVLCYFRRVVFCMRGEMVALSHSSGQNILGYDSFMPFHFAQCAVAFLSLVIVILTRSMFCCFGRVVAVSRDVLLALSRSWWQNTLISDLSIPFHSGWWGGVSLRFTILILTITFSVIWCVRSSANWHLAVAWNRTY